MSEFKRYKKKGFAEMRTATQEDQEKGIPGFEFPEVKINEGDMIARDPNNHDDMWLIRKDYFEKNFEKTEE